MERTGTLILMLLCLFSTGPITCVSANIRLQIEGKEQRKGEVIEVKGGPESVIWVVQLSDLHFSVHHPDRALDFKKIVGSALRMINPSLVLITGDLTGRLLKSRVLYNGCELHVPKRLRIPFSGRSHSSWHSADGKSKDLLTMKQNEDEWLEYQNVMEDVIKRSELDKNIFYDLRGNHDNFGVPAVGGSFDFFSNYSINGNLGRKGNVNSITLETSDRKHLFVGLDTTMSVGLRGPTNLFGHPTDHLLTQVDSQLSQWDSQSNKPVTKIAFGHFPLSFSAISLSGKSLKDTFLNNSLTAYLCGHLHSRFGKNLKRHHQSSKKILSSQKFFQFDMHQRPSGLPTNCSFEASPPKEFWEWEMGDWRKSRAMRILAIDGGHVSYLDINFNAEARKTIILPTFPLDSRTMSTSSWHQKYECQHMIPPSFETVRALVFSVSPIMSVMARIYDAKPGTLDLVMETPMTKVVGMMSRGDFYAAPWNHRAFEDPAPDRFWLQIEVIDIMGRSTLTELRPFSVNGRSAKISWTWKEFFVMGCQWAALYYPILWFLLYLALVVLLIPKFLLMFSRKNYTYRSFIVEKSSIHAIIWVLQDLCRLPIAWFGFLGYLFYLLVCPWFTGQVFTAGGDKVFMTYMGWVIRSVNDRETRDYIGSPDVMVVVLPHVFFVALPAIVVAGALAAEREMFKEHFLSRSGKKEDDAYSQNKTKSRMYDKQGDRTKSSISARWIRKVLLVVCLAICWKHLMNCRALIKAYEMNPLLHFPVYSLGIPLLLAYSAHRTRRI